MMADSKLSLVFTWTVKDAMTSLSLVLLYIATVESGWEYEQEDEIVVPIPPQLISADLRSSKKGVLLEGEGLFETGVGRIYGI